MVCFGEKQLPTTTEGEQVCARQDPTQPKSERGLMQQPNQCDDGEKM